MCFALVALGKKSHRPLHSVLVAMVPWRGLIRQSPAGARWVHGGCLTTMAPTANTEDSGEIVNDT